MARLRNFRAAGRVHDCMALLSRRLETNVPGDFFVDDSCINCDACRQIAPEVFGEVGDQSAVVSQPLHPAGLLAAQKALISCPTASIGTTDRRDLRAVSTLYPEVLAGNVYFCGYTSESSFGALSYFVRRDEGNLLVDSPRFAAPLVKRIETLGGVQTMLLTHRDDVADHAKFRRRFECRRVLHRDDVSGSTAEVEYQPQDQQAVELAPDLLLIPVPGHTKGHVVYLYQEKYLFTGDHLAWDDEKSRLYAFRGACWYSWAAQIESMKRLLEFRFEWVLPGHGRRMNLPAARMRHELEKCIDWMETRW